MAIYSDVTNRGLFKILHALHNMQHNTPKDTAPDSVGSIMREIRDELKNRGFSADCKDVLNGDHSFDFDPDSPSWYKVYQLDVDPELDQGRVEDLFRVHYLKRCTSPYDCSGETFTMTFYVFKRRGSWWAYELLGSNV